MLHIAFGVLTLACTDYLEMSRFSFEEWCRKYNIGGVAKTWLENNTINDEPALRSLQEHHIPVQ